ncbi:RAM signaling pathway protein-domain-containing protein [Infundibulicybe gibba]|nr:RAM signaling pathway protein-domain-containing protein [Infundibulicybe gibba]
MLDVDRPVLESPQYNKTMQSTPLAPPHISQALGKSSDGGVTLNLSKLNISDVGVLAAEELALIGRTSPDDESVVERIALNGNRLTTLPTEFALLSRLRYLNLRHNSFSVFPDVLTLMPSLDTLDLSYNKLKRLPSQPGHLIHLRVFCLSRNKIVRLPTYISQFQQLEVLRVDHNHIEWPPKSVMVLDKTESRPEMREWIHQVQDWIIRETATPTRDDPGYNERQLDRTHPKGSESWQFPVHESDFDAGVTPHARSFSVDSNFSLSSLSESFRELQAASPMYNTSADRPPPLHLGILQSYSTETSPTRSLESYLPSPANSDTFFDEIPPTNDPPHHHGRNASYAGGLHAGRREERLAKQSMPDLRTAKLNFSKRIPDLPESNHYPVHRPNKSRNLDEFSIPSPLSLRQDSGSSLNSTSRLAKPLPKDTSQAAVVMATERNSYFNRMSSLPSSSILPPPLVCLAETARSILFAVSQIFQTLEHYTIHAVDDRLSSILKKVLDPASADMMRLINSLDRFDAISRKTSPPPAVCRGLVESCKDTVASISKAVAVLSLQLKVIVASNDARYSRWILLELHGATAELACAWQSILQQIDSIKPLLHTKPFMMPNSQLSTGNLDLPLPASQPILSPLPEPSSSLRVHTQTVSGHVGRTRTARRHAGSFSSKDVEIGKKLPSHEDMPSLPGIPIPSAATHTTMLRTPKRHITLPLTPAPTLWSSTSSSGTNSHTPNSFTSVSNHSRQGSLASLTSLQASSSSSSPSISAKTPYLELPSNSKTQVDKEALHAVQEALDVAPIVWDMIEDYLASSSEANVPGSLEQARRVTKNLAGDIRAMHESDGQGDRKSLREDANQFLKTVVHLSNIIKTHADPRAVPAALRSNMVKLTNSTEEFAILLHVSSLSPSTPRSHSPMPHTPLQGNLDDSRLGSSLSRSRSAQPSASIKITAPSPQDGPRSALPTQSFKIPHIRRFRGKDSRVDITDPG